MKIQRFKVLRENFLEERDFSNSPRENLLTFGEEVLLNIMKVIEMYHDFNDGQYTKHWIKKIANNLGVECTCDDNTVCEVLNKIGDEMPLIKGERIAKVPLEVGMDLQGKTLYFDTTKTIPVEGENKNVSCGMPSIQFALERADGNVVLKAHNYGDVNDVIYENGTWYMNSYTVVNTQSDNNKINSIDHFYFRV